MSGEPVVEGLRERKKRQTRQLISDTATMMFLDRGFDAVKVAEVATACGVSEKTVYNYFPTKESLLLDRQEETEAGIRRALGADDLSVSAVEAAVRVLEEDLTELGEDVDPEHLISMIRRFSALVESTPSLRAAQRDMMDRLVEVAAEALAERSGLRAHDPEPQIAATAIVGLWRIQFNALHRYAEAGRPAAEIFSVVADEVRRAARLIETGLWSSTLVAPTTGTREQIKAAADAAMQAKKQVQSALQQAKVAWREAAKAHEAATRAAHHDAKAARRRATR